MKICRHFSLLYQLTPGLSKENYFYYDDWFNPSNFRLYKNTQSSPTIDEKKWLHNEELKYIPYQQFEYEDFIHATHSTHIQLALEP